MLKSPRARLPRRITLAVFVLLLIAIVAAQAEGHNRTVTAATPVVRQAESGLLMPRIAKGAVRLIVQAQRTDRLSGSR